MTSFDSFEASEPIRPERVFAKNASFRYIHLLARRWTLSLAGDHRLERAATSLTHVFLCANSPSSLLGVPVFDLFEKARPDARSITEQARLQNIAIRLLACAARAHFFLFKLDILETPPTLFSIPDVGNLNEPVFGLVYPLLQSQRSLVVCERDLSRIGLGHHTLGDFPVVLGSNHEHWFDTEAWQVQESQSVSLRQLADPPTHRFAKRQAPALQGRAIQVEQPLRDLFRQAGLRPIEGTNQMALAPGFDSALLEEFMAQKSGHLQKILGLAHTNVEEAFEFPTT